MYHRLRRAAARIRSEVSSRAILAAMSRAERALGLTWSVPHAIRRSVRRELSPDEAGLVGRIEQVRREMESSREELHSTDYGAGSPGMGLTALEMRKGRAVVSTVGETCLRASKDAFWCTVLFMLIRERRPLDCLELGTALGVSACYQAAALRLNGSGRLVTLEGDERMASIARDNLSRLGLDSAEVRVGRFQDMLQGVLEELSTVDYAFIDGHHDEEATMRYFERVASVASHDALLVFDDISWSDGMARAWRCIREDPRVVMSLDAGMVGICRLSEQSGRKSRQSHFTLPLRGFRR
ncbi:class I SAM-dependent methyltransferase [Candidatus Fermentibacterales bacterium]|nr:class I SAM-dependent methyltransferase [Candidatus Fermentibacterales bacterium]